MRRLTQGGFFRWFERLRMAFRMYGTRKGYHWSSTITLFAFIALFPIVIYLTIVIRFLPQGLLVRFLDFWLPEQAVQAVLRQIRLIGTPSPIDWILSLIAIVGAISHIFHSIIEISDDVYGYHGRHFWERRKVAIGIMLVFIGWQLITMLFYVASDWIVHLLQNLPFIRVHELVIRFPGFIRFLSVTSVMVLQWCSLLLLFGMAAPEFHPRDQIPGATFTTLTWWIVSRILGMYFRWVPVEDIYGALTGILVFIFWVYYASMLLIVGICLNAITARERRIADREEAAFVIATPT